LETGSSFAVYSVSRWSYDRHPPSPISGSSFLPQMLATEYGSRRLGFLAVTAVATTELQGAKELHRLLKANASSQTSQYVLDEEQTEKMWLMGRELFFDSPVHQDFLSIVSRCQRSSKENLASAAYPDQATDFLAPMMMACFWAWDMATVVQKQHSHPRGKILIQGATGFGQLIPYLTAVCGFRVTARLNQMSCS
jgi:hypothetical protein